MPKGAHGGALMQLLEQYRDTLDDPTIPLPPAIAFPATFPGAIAGALVAA